MRFPQKLAVLPLVVAALAIAPSARSAPDEPAPQPVSVALRPGAGREAVLKFLLKPYAAATGTEIGESAWDGFADTLKKLFVEKKADLALVGGPVLASLCHAQVFARVDWQVLGREKFLPLAVSDCGVGAYLSATVLAWDRDKLKASPGWGDFWDVAKYPGRRGLQKHARGTLEIALLADGVAPGDIYRTLRASEGVDRAFRKLDQLKPYIEWWDASGQPAQYLASGKVLLTSAPTSLLPFGPKSHVGVQWAGSLDEVTSWAVAQGAAHPQGAWASINIATDAARQAEFFRATFLGPSTRAGEALLPEDARAQSPASVAHLQSGLAVDEGFWLDNGDRLEARFSAWVAK